MTELLNTPSHFRDAARAHYSYAARANAQATVPVVDATRTHAAEAARSHYARTVAGAAR
jgi:hypothetical protein